MIEAYKKIFKKHDAEVAKRQVEIFKCAAEGEITPFDRFLAFFNGVLFGSETSRNSTSFVTGLIVLELISKGKLTYIEAFQTTDDEANFAAYPMASPFAGSGNILAYKAFVNLSEEEAATNGPISSSSIGMKSSRKTPQWAQIQLKEAILLTYFAKENVQVRDAVEFINQFSKNLTGLLGSYFMCDEEKLRGQ